VTSFFSVVFFERDSELTLFGFGTAQSQSAEPQLEVHRASCPQIADSPLSSTFIFLLRLILVPHDSTL
jgi:hypothetical protein